MCEHVPTGENKPVAAANMARSNSGDSMGPDMIRVIICGFREEDDPTRRESNAAALFSFPLCLKAWVCVPVTHLDERVRRVPNEEVAGATNAAAVALMVARNDLRRFSRC